MAYKFCPNCKTANKKYAKKCISCGYSLSGVKTIQKKYKKGVLASRIVFITPITLLILFTAIYVKRGVDGDADYKNLKEEKSTEISEVKSDNTISDISSEEPEKTFYDYLCENMGDSQAKDVYDILTEKLGFVDSELVFEKKEETPEVYYVYLDSVEYKITACEGVYRIWNDLYVLYEDGEVQNTKTEIKDKEFSTSEASAYYIMAQDAVKEQLKNPKSAQFPSFTFSAGEIAIIKNKNLVAVQSYVTAKNSFNAKVKTQFTVQFYVDDIDTFTYTLTYIKLGDESSGDFIEME